MRFVQLLVLSIIVLVSCGGRRPISDLEHPEQAALHYVQCLQKGDYAAYASGMLVTDSASDVYHQRMTTLLKQMVTDKTKELGPIVEVTYIDQLATVIENCVDVQFSLRFEKDSTERYVVPLVWTGNCWRIR